MINKFNKKKTKKIRQINLLLKILYHTPKSHIPIAFNEVKEILIIDPTAIGDIVMLIPFLRIIKKNIPYANITLVGCKWSEQILKNQYLVDEFIIIKKEIFNFPIIKRENRLLYREVLEKINQKQYELALEPRGDLRYIFFMHYCNAKRKISYNYTGGECFLTDVIIPGENVEHLVEDKIYFLKQLRFRVDENDIYPKLYLTETQKKENRMFIEEIKKEIEIIIGIHPGASLDIKQWKGYDKLIRKIQNELKNVCFFIFEGPNEEEAVKKVLIAGKKVNAKVYHIKKDIPQYMQCLSICDWVICNDSGAGHIAAAYGRKVISIFGPVLPSLAKPYGIEGIFTISDDSLSCKPCISSTCHQKYKCIDCVTVDEVYNVLINNL